MFSNDCNSSKNNSQIISKCFNNYKNEIYLNSCNTSITLTRNIILKGVSLVYLCAFSSIFFQIQGLWGDEGILPAYYLNKKLNENLNESYSFFKVPSLTLHYSEFIAKLYLPIFNLFTKIFYNNPNIYINFSNIEHSMHFLCLIGILISLSIVLNVKIMINKISFIILFISYLNFYLIGQVFMSFQWDVYLLEVGFLVILLVPIRSKNIDKVYPLEELAFNLIKFLNFRFIYSSGIVKVTSNCPTWLSLKALNHHFQSQPLPNYLSIYAHLSTSNTIKSLLVIGTFILELYIPFLLFVPFFSDNYNNKNKFIYYIIRFFRRLSIFSGICVFLFQIGIILTGNYNFFNLLTIIVNLSSFDDEFIRIIFPYKLIKYLNLETYKLNNKENLNNISDIVNELDNNYFIEKNKLTQKYTEDKSESIKTIQNSNDMEERKQIVNRYLKERADTYRKAVKTLDQNNCTLKKIERDIKTIDSLQIIDLHNVYNFFKFKNILKEIMWFSNISCIFGLLFFTKIYPIRLILDSKLKLNSKNDLKYVFNKSFLNLYCIFVFAVIIIRYVYSSFSLYNKRGFIIKSIDNNIYKLNNNNLKNFFKYCVRITVFIVTIVTVICVYSFYFISMSSIFYQSLGLKLFNNTLNSTKANSKYSIIKENLLFNNLKSFEIYSNNIVRRMHIVSGYGLFRVMTGIGGRPELEILVTDKETLISNIDNENNFKEVNFKYKPQINKFLKITGPHQPRIDWQIWFSALKPNYSDDYWLIILVGKLLEKNPVILDLLGYKVKERQDYYNNSLFDKVYDKYYNIKKEYFMSEFANNEKDLFNIYPKIIKINSYIYKFNKLDSYKNNKDIWTREYNIDYLPPVNIDSLKVFLKRYGIKNVDPSRTIFVYPLQNIALIDIIITLVLCKMIYNIFMLRKNI